MSLKGFQFDIHLDYPAIATQENLIYFLILQTETEIYSDRNPLPSSIPFFFTGLAVLSAGQVGFSCNLETRPR